MSKKLYDSFSKEKILKLYIDKRMPLSKIAIKFDVSHKTMKKFFETNGINVKGRVSGNKWLADKDWLREQYASGCSVQKIATMANASRGNVYSALKYANIPIRNISEGIRISHPNRSGENSSRWKGGKRITGQNGRYLEVKRPNHPNANADGYILEQRLVMSEHLGRPLTQDEIIHHRDGDGHNNDINNLELTTKKKHFNNHFDAVKEVARLQKILISHNISY